METADVVTVFLRDTRTGDVLLLRRSDETGSYTGQWGAVSGYVEGETQNPEEDARREIHEETGMLEDDVTFVRGGDAFVVEDDELGKRWRVHPFLFDTQTRNIETNYETVRYDWCSPTEILRRETVPDLWRSYASVAPSVESVRKDDEHGSAYVAARALEALRDAAAKNEDARATAHELVEARPSMVAVGNRVARAADGETAEGIEEEAHAAIAEAYNADERAASEAADRLGGSRRVVTLSRSGTVALALADVSPDEVVVAESLPGGEGVEFADELGARTQVVPDSCVARETEDGDAVVVGSDAILPDGTVVNKVGSLAAALAARHHDVPFFVVAATDKIAPADGSEHENEYVEAHGERVGVFESVPPELVELVTDEGVLSEGKARERAEEHARFRSRLR